MYNLVLSCTNFPIVGPIIEYLAHILGYLMNWIYLFFDMIGYANIGICIIIFTIIVKLIMMPLTYKQQKFSKVSSIMNPEIQAIQKKYKDKRDNESIAKMRDETKAVYEKYASSPTGGCLQLAIQMPILLALYQVILNIKDYIPKGYSNTFLGMDLSKTPWQMLGIAIAIPILSGGAQWLSAKLTQGMQPIATENNPMASSMKTMLYTMPIISAVFCFTFPAGVGLYWVASSIFQVVSQLLINRHFNKVDVNEIIKKNVEKANKKREKKGIPSQKVNNSAKYNTRNIPQPKENNDNKKYENSNSDVSQKESIKKGSLSAKANMVKDFNEKNNKK